jgi:hypothetical protein
MPASWFPPQTHGVLRCFCRAVVTAEMLWLAYRDACAGYDPLGPRHTMKLATMYHREVSAIARLSNDLRLTPQARRTRPKSQAGAWDD